MILLEIKDAFSTSSYYYESLEDKQKTIIDNLIKEIKKWNIKEISLGDFVLSGGEPALISMLDATIRLIPGVLGNADSILEESFSNNLLEYPQYTKPQDWEGRKVPDVLISGHHGNIQKWRQEQSEILTKTRRPDLYNKYLDNQKKGN